MPTQLLDLPPELVEHILALLAHQDASSLPACRQTCRALNTTIEQSQLVRYIERTALLGVYDPLVPITDVFAGTSEAVDGTSTANTMTNMTIPERAAALEAWNEAWSALDDVLFRRKPDLRVAMPSRDELQKGRMAEVVGVTGSRKFATTPTTTSTAAVRGPEAEAELLDHQRRWWDEGPENEWHCHFSFGPWFVAAAREGPGVRAGYSYLDVYGSLGAAAEASSKSKGMGASSTGADCEDEEGEEGLRWTTINVPVRNIVVFALSTELDLAVAISCVPPTPHSIPFLVSYHHHHLIIKKLMGKHNKQTKHKLQCQGRSQRGYDNESFGGAPVALPRWDAASVRRGADDTCERDRCVGTQYGADAGARGVYPALDRRAR
jgi:hypothetical protein